MIDSKLSGIVVVIVNYNGGEYVLDCLSALLNQSISPDRVIVVDNNSSDRSNTKISEQFPQIDLIQLEQNTGFAGGNNRAFDAIEDGSWVALLNPDTIPAEDWLERLANAATENPNCSVFASQLISAADNKIIDGTGDIYHVCGLSWRRHHGMPTDHKPVILDPVFSPCGAAAMYRLDGIRQVGGFDEDYFCYNEDVDMVFRMRLLGHQCLYVENSLVAHVGSGVTGIDSDFSIYHGHRNLIWTYVKNMPGWYVLLYLPQHIMLNIISLLYYTAKGRGGVIWKSKWHALKGLGQVLSKRKQIQKNRTVSADVVTDVMTKGFTRPYFSRFK